VPSNLRRLRWLPIDSAVLATVFHLIISLDYELPAGGRGDVLRHLVLPSERLLHICERHGAKLTIMAEMGELWAFEELANSRFSDQFAFPLSSVIRDQLRGAIRRGHDVQLHLHPQWLRARWQGSRWFVDYAHYKLTDFSLEEMTDSLCRGKRDLEAMFRPIAPDYRCIGFRAGNWNTQPCEAYLAALRQAGLQSDSSVFKWGYTRNPAADVDYRRAWSNVRPWFADGRDINSPSAAGEILEVPIAAEQVHGFQLLRPHRLVRSLRCLAEDLRVERQVQQALGRKRQIGKSISASLGRVFGCCSRKLDFCKLSGREMLEMAERLMQQCGTALPRPVPLMMIGHSKEFTDDSDMDFLLGELRRRHGHEMVFTTYRGFVAQYLAAVRQQQLPMCAD